MTRTYRLIVLCVASLGSVTRAQGSEPVAAYAFSEGSGTTVADASGNGNAGTLTAGSSWTTDGKFGNGLVLGGGSQGINVSPSPALDLASGLTLEAWICPDSIAGYPKIIWRDGAGGSPFNLGLAHGNGSLVFGILTTTGFFSVSAYSSVVANVWTHVAASYDGVALRLYIDGVLVSTSEASGTIVPSASDLWLGRAPWGEGLTGRYDEVRIYDRALTAAEIALDRATQVSEPDPPDVGDRTPASDVMGVPPSTAITATFSTAINPATVTGSSFYLAGPSGHVPAVLAFDAATRVATLTPAAPLATMTSYTAHITTDISATDESRLRTPVTWTFTTSPEPELAHAAFGFSEGTGGTTTVDSSGNGNTGTLTGPGQWSSEGRYGNGLLLGGTWDGARVPAAVSLDVGPSLTLEAWVHPASIANYPKLIWRDGRDGSPYSLGMSWGNGSVAFGITTTAGPFSVYAYGSIVADTWTHIAATYDGSRLSIYINGQLANVSTGAGSILSSTRDLWLGRAPWGEGFVGILDDVRIYGRALTAAEIAIDMGTAVSEAVPPPIITPDSATYASAQAVSMTAPTAGTILRYTVDGTDPGASSPVYAGPITVDTFTVLKAKAFREGWTPSNTATATFAFNYGTLAPPVAGPAGGTYPSGQVVALTAETGTQIRYTLDGTDPDAGSPPYAVPFPLPDGPVTLKARAFKVDWTASPTIVEVFTIGDDVWPPVITASRVPDANLGGWNNTDVTVTFSCTDPSGIAVCTAPIRVRGEGYGIPVTGAATDTWGNHASTSWSVNIDRTPPAVHVYVPGEAWNFPGDTTSVTIRGGAAELSGLQSVSCGGVAATLTGNLFVCSVGVGAGANTVLIRASDVAGNEGSAAISFTVGDADPGWLEISPGTMTMFAGDSREITVADQQGNAVHEGAWEVLDPSIAAVSESDGSIVVAALTAGQTTVSVMFRGHTAHATVSVFPPGSSPPAGTTIWSLNDALGLVIPKRGEVLRAASTTVDGDASNAPALLFVDPGTEWQASTLLRFEGHPTRIRTTTIDGRQLSDVRFAGRVPQQIAADNDGGFVVVLPARDGLPSTIQRFDSRSGSITWEYIATSGYLSDVAVHPDGTIYAAEGHVVGGNYLVAMTPAGLVRTTPLPQGRFTQIDTGACGLDSASSTPGYVTGPIILDDGSVVLVSKVTTAQRIVFSYRDERALSGCGVQSHPQDYSSIETAQVVQLSSSGALAVHVLEDSGRRIASQFYPEDSRLVPDGHGGLLLGRRKTPSVVRINADYRVVASNFAILPEDGATRYETEYVLSEDGAYALVNSVRTVSLRPFAYAYESKVVQFDAETLQRVSDSNLGIPMTQPQHLRLKFSLAGGGVYAVGPTTAYVVNTTVDTAGFAAGGNATHVANGLWGGWMGDGTPSVAPGAEAFIAQNRWAYAAGFGNINAPSPRLLTTARLREMAAERGIGAGRSGVLLNQAIGLEFQGIAIWSLYQSDRPNSIPKFSPLRTEFTAGIVRNVIPDYLSAWRHGNTGEIYPDSVFTEVKAVAGLIRLPYSRNQIRGLIDATKIWSPLGTATIHWPMMEFITTADTLFGLDVVEAATSRRVEVRQRMVWELGGGYLQVTPGRSLNGTLWTMLSERTALPALLPGRTSAPLGSHPGASPPDDPDPPTVEP